MQDQLELRCTEHDEDQCPDQVITLLPNGGMGIPIRDGGDSAYEIHFCPWCGTPATPEAWEAKTAGSPGRSVTNVIGEGASVGSAIQMGDHYGEIRL